MKVNSVSKFLINSWAQDLETKNAFINNYDKGQV